MPKRQVIVLSGPRVTGKSTAAQIIRDFYDTCARLSYHHLLHESTYTVQSFGEGMELLDGDHHDGVLIYEVQLLTPSLRHHLREALSIAFPGGFDPIIYFTTEVDPTFESQLIRVPGLSGHGSIDVTAAIISAVLYKGA